jgi:hypothetical protein
MKYDPDTGNPLYTWEEVKQIVNEAMDALKETALSHQLFTIMHKFHENASRIPRLTACTSKPPACVTSTHGAWYGAR